MCSIRVHVNMTSVKALPLFLSSSSNNAFRKFVTDGVGCLHLFLAPAASFCHVWRLHVSVEFTTVAQWLWRSAAKHEVVGSIAGHGGCILMGADCKYTCVPCFGCTLKEPQVVKNYLVPFTDNPLCQFWDIKPHNSIFIFQFTCPHLLQWVLFFYGQKGCFQF